MAHTLTLEIPDEIYEDLKKQAATFNRTVEDELLQRVKFQTQEDKLPDDLEQVLASLTLLDDPALWKAARSRLPLKSAKRLERLHFKRQREGSLTQAEDHEASALVRQAERIMLVRAQAALLLKERGFDVIELGPKDQQTETKSAKTPEELGWPPGFFEQTYGSISDYPDLKNIQ